MKSIDRCTLAPGIALAVIVGAGIVAAQETDRPEPAPSCVHELAYESFAGLILVPVTIGDSPPLDFILDSGANQSAITDPYLSAALGLEVSDAGLARGMGSGATRVLIADDICIRGDGHEILCSSLVVHDIGVRLAAMAGRDIHGFLGAEVFHRYVVELDGDNRRLLLHDPKTFVYKGGGQILPLEVIDNRPVIDGSVVVKAGKKPVPVRLVVDTGSGRFLTLVTGSRRQLKPPAERTISGSIGVVGDTLVVVGAVAELRLGSLVVSNVSAAWMESFQIPAVRNIPKLNGILGNPLLSRYHVYFDYSRGQLIID